MPNQKITTKKLKAIVFVDIVNFTAISEENEQKALDLIQKQNEIAKPVVLKHKGEWLKELGDGLLFSFDSSLDAVKCSIEIQNSVKEVKDLVIRIGIHQGDIFLKDGDVFGSDVNIASRIESFAPSGGICVSDKVYNDIYTSPEIKSEYLGYRRLKGIENEIKLRCIYSDKIPRHRINKLPLVIGIFFNFLGYLGVVICLGRILTNIYYGLDMLAHNTMLLWYKGNIFQMLFLSLGLICIGYTNIAHVRGVSYKSQRNIVYFGYLIFISIILSIIYLKITTGMSFIEYDFDN